MIEPEVDRLRRAWIARGLFEHIAVYDTLGSTQDEALRLARKLGACVVFASHQTAGRGTRGKPWHERPGLGLACSIALRVDQIDASEISCRVAVACAKAIESAGLDRARIKWPNDIVDAHDRKLAGILIEISDPWAIIGMGINIRHQPDDFPEPIRPASASLAMLDVDTTPPDLAHTLEGSLHRALAEPIADILSIWRERDALVGTRQTLSCAGRTVTGEVVSIDPTSEITVETAAAIERLDPRTTSLA